MFFARLPTYLSAYRESLMNGRYLLRLVSGCLVALGATVSLSAQEAKWPSAKAVPAQPLLSQVLRLSQAMEALGQPLPESVTKALAALSEDSGDAKVTQIVQEQLDPLCMTAVDIGDDGVASVVPAAKSIPLLEQGWQLMLVKVNNRVGAKAVLRADSPNARPLPNSPADEVENRWMGLLPYTGQPLLPTLSGLGLEYTLLQVFSRDTGAKTAEIRFSLEGWKKEGQEKGNLIRQWKFDKDTDGWMAQKNCELEAVDGSLKVKITSEDPYFATNVVAKEGTLVLRFWAHFNKPGVGQIFWWTKKHNMPDGSRLVNFMLEPGRGAEYMIRIPVQEELAGVRIDPGNDPDVVKFDWISLSYEKNPNSNVAGAKFAFDVRPANTVTFDVTEEDGTLAMAAFLIKDKDGRVYPPQAKRLAPDFFFQPQVYRATGETVKLPKGKYTVVCSRGPESIPELQELVVGDGPAKLKYVVKRWADPSLRGWWSGDHHIHAAGCLHYDNPTEGVLPSDMLRHIQGEDLKVGCCLTWGPCFDYQKRFFTGKPDDVSQYPYLLRYDIEVSGFGSQASGHLNLLRLTEQIPPGGGSKHHWPTLGMNTLRWAKKQGAVCGPAHSGNGLTRWVGRVEGAVDGPHLVPNYNIPAYDGIGANEFVVQAALKVPGPDGKAVPAVDFISTMNTDRVSEWSMWYHVLNCGLRVRASGETDFPCLTGERVGIGRVYVKLDGKLDFDTWAQGIADGRCYVSDGTTHLMDYVATSNGKNYEVGLNGSEIKLDKGGKVSLSVLASVRQPGKKTVPVDLVVNGLPVETKELICDGRSQTLSFETEITKSSWVAIRVFPSAHTNPFFVIVDDKPIRASKMSAQWCLQGIDQCWQMKRDSYRQDEFKQAEEDYEAARKVYRQILAESN